ncbi:hypothetical protein [Variovorax gossypii]
MKFNLYFAALFSLVAGLVRGVWPPLYGWFVTDVWQWEPFDHWLRYVILGALIGAIAGTLFAIREWCIQASASPLRKFLITAAAIALCIGVIAFSREHVGRIFGGQ